MKIEIGQDKQVTIYRERPATEAERRKDNGAKVMAEWVTIKFGKDAPKVTVNRDLCE